MASVTILIPVGPQAVYLDYLPEALESVLKQTVQPAEILLVGDGVNIDVWALLERVGLRVWGDTFTEGIHRYRLVDSDLNVRFWRTAWNIGFAPAFNCGVGLAENDLIIYLAADDKLYPTAVEDCLATWEANNHKDAWYSMTYQVEGGPMGDVPNNAAMITRDLWRWMGGYPPAAFAGPDALALSCLMVHASDRIIKVTQGKPNYWVRQHPEQETKRQFSFYAASGIMEVIRNKETERFTPHTEVSLK